MDFIARKNVFVNSKCKKKGRKSYKTKIPTSLSREGMLVGTKFRFCIKVGSINYHRNVILKVWIDVLPSFRFLSVQTVST